MPAVVDRVASARPKGPSCRWYGRVASARDLKLQARNDMTGHVVHVPLLPQRRMCRLRKTAHKCRVLVAMFWTHMPTTESLIE